MRLSGTCTGSNTADSNYLRINRINDEDTLYALIIDDNDVSYQDVNSSNDVTMVNGAWTDEFNRIAGDRFHLPNIGLGSMPMAGGFWTLTGIWSQMVQILRIGIQMGIG